MAVKLFAVVGYAFVWNSLSSEVPLHSSNNRACCCASFFLFFYFIFIKYKLKYNTAKEKL